MINRLRFISILLLSVCLLGCRTNNGDIGPLYGQWTLQSMTIDDEPAEIDCSVFSIRFQNNIVCLTELLGFEDFINSVGTWQMDGSVLSLDFTHTTASGTMAHISADLLIAGDAVTDFDVISLTASLMQISQEDESGRIIKYTFKKLK